ncbi:MAG: hypothetical protein KF805_08320 [Phycisphaeraceae bacterium]|nr:hypothetical protein [Phycisphaeraceae bacterium]
MNSAPLLPAWVVLPVAAIMLLVVATHLMVLLRSDMPASRKRIRTLNGWIMLFLVPIGAAAFGVESPSDPRLFVLVWSIVILMLVLLIGLALLDMMNTTRLYRRERDKLGDHFGQSPREPEKRDQ